MNRRRLVIVGVLAALFGAVLPYLEFVLILPLYAAKGSNAQPIVRNGYDLFRGEQVFTDGATVSWLGGPPPETSWAQMQADCHNALPLSLFENRLEGVQSMSVHRTGWPFRGIHMCFVIDKGGKRPTETAVKGGELRWAWADKRRPGYWPVGIL